MSRHIDADRMKTIKSIQSADFNSIETIREWIDAQPTVDVVEVVRCKGCKYWTHRICRRFQDKRIRFADDYCSFGERKNEV